MGSSEKRSRVLIVDNNAAARDYARNELEKSNFIVDDVKDLRSALTAFEQIKPDAVLLDVDAAGSNGIASCEAIRKLPLGEHTPIMMLADIEDLASVYQTYQIGATDFLTKPIDWRLLSHRMHCLIRSYQTIDHLERDHQRLLHTQKIAHIGGWEWNIQTGQFYWPDELSKLLGIPENKIPQQHQDLLQFIHPQDQARAKESFDKAFTKIKPYEIEYRIVTANNDVHFVHEEVTMLHNTEGVVISMVGMIQDITARKKTENEVTQLAYYDSLTGLANRVLFKEHLEMVLSAAKRNKQSIAVLFLDIDNFKNINDNFGHHAGDQVLQKISDRLLHCLRGTDCVTRTFNHTSIRPVARLGGDEFTILLTNNLQAQGLTKILQRIIEEINNPLKIENHEVNIGISIGVSVYPSDGEDSSELVKHADTAMYAAKQSGKNNFCFYDKAMNASALHKLQMERDLQQAIERNEFLLFFQPRVDLQTKKITAVEALIRWQHPKLGLLEPKDFISLAEDSGLIIPIGEWVVQEACQQLKQWQQDGCSDLHMMINFSVKNILEPSFVNSINQTIDNAKISANNLELEFSEKILISHDLRTIDVLQRLKALGIKITIDNFGMGMSSLRFLGDFPLDALKIDRSFISTMSTDNVNKAITKTIITLGQGLNFSVYGIGVEMQEQLDLLEQFGCQEIQGNLISQAIPAEAMKNVLSGHCERSEAIQFKKLK